MGERRRITTKPILTLLIGLLKRTALKAEAHVGCCHGAHQGDGSRLPKMAALLLGHPAEINLSGAPSFLNLDLLSAPASFIYMPELSCSSGRFGVSDQEEERKTGLLMAIMFSLPKSSVCPENVSRKLIIALNFIQQMEANWSGC